MDGIGVVVTVMAERERPLLTLTLAPSIWASAYGVTLCCSDTAESDGLLVDASNALLTSLNMAADEPPGGL